MASSFWPNLAEVKSYLGVTTIDDDDYLQAQMDATEATIEKYCGRWFENAEQVETFRFTDFDKYYSRINGLRLHRVPIETITSITDADGADVYTWEQGENGYIQGNFLNVGKDVIITYRGGFDPIPPDVLDVYYQMMSIRYQLKGYQVPLTGNLKSQSIPNVMTESYYNTGTDTAKAGFGLSAPDNFSYTLDSYILRDF